MSELISFDAHKIDRNNYAFATKSILLHDEYGKQRLFYIIVLVEKSNRNIVAYTGYEKYVVDLSLVDVNSEMTNKKTFICIVDFLNYILHNTKVNSINEITVNNIRGYLLNARTKDNGEEVKENTWLKKRQEVVTLLENYYTYNHEVVAFGYSLDELRKKTVITRVDKTTGRSKKYVINDYKSLGVARPKANNHKRRNRVLMYGHLETLLYVAKKYDPMIHLAIMLMAYAGLREGEVVNLAFNNITEVTIMGSLRKITLNLSDSDKFRMGKTHFGATKKIREQDVYPKFLKDVKNALEYHKDLLQAHGYPTSGNNAVFINNRGKPMSVDTLTLRIKTLFKDYFLPALEKTSEGAGFEAETTAYIDAYKAQYPGAHMLRHWYTMYLITKEKLSPAEVRKWRGDSPNSDSYEQYLHVNAELMDAYKNTAYTFQESLLEDING